MKTIEAKILSQKEYFDDLYYSIIKNNSREFNEIDKKLIIYALAIASIAHEGQIRKSGEPYITHPIDVAKIVSQEIGLGTTAIVSAILHDVVEDSYYTLDDIRYYFRFIENDNKDKFAGFGDRVAVIIDGLTKIENYKKIEDKHANNFVNISEQAQNYMHLFQNVIKDIRVIFIKIADRLHNLRTIKSMNNHQQDRSISEALLVYAPLSESLGLYKIKTEIEEIAFEINKPDDFYSIKNKLDILKDGTDNIITELINDISEILKEKNIKAKVIGRTKSVYSIYKKMQNKKIPFESVYDIFAVRIIVADSQFADIEKYKISEFKEYKDYVNYCTSKNIVPPSEYDYATRILFIQIISYISFKYAKIDGRTRDWIRAPKENGYKAYHSSVMVKGKKVEIQIRTQQMDDIAEKGIAAHWKYKDVDQTLEAKFIDKIKLAYEKSKENPKALIDDDNFLYESRKKLQIWTPKGKAIFLPEGATALDFAYKIHTDIGNHANKAIVNGSESLLSRKLKYDDQVEIVTSISSAPNSEWKNWVTTNFARNAINEFLNKINDDTGKAYLEYLEILKKRNVIISSEDLKSLYLNLNAKNKKDFFEKINNKEISLEEIEDEITNIINIRKNNICDGDYSYTFATCCNPIYGDEIGGYQKNNCIEIHKRDCLKFINLAGFYDKKHIVTIKWPNIKGEKLLFERTIEIKGNDRKGIVLNLATIIYDIADINIKEISIKTDENKMFNGRLVVWVHQRIDLDNIISKIKKMENIYFCEEVVSNYISE